MNLLQIDLARKFMAFEAFCLRLMIFIVSCLFQSDANSTSPKLTEVEGAHTEAIRPNYSDINPNPQVATTLLAYKTDPVDTSNVKRTQNPLASKFVSDTVIVPGRPFEVNCNAHTAKFPQKIKDLGRLEIAREVTTFHGPKLSSIAWMTPDQTFAENSGKTRKWSFDFLGGSPSYKGPTRDMNIRWVLNDARCVDDAGAYFCHAYMLGNVSVASFEKITVTARAPIRVSLIANPYSKDHDYEVKTNVTVTCIVYGPPKLTISMFSRTASSLGRFINLDMKTVSEPTVSVPEEKCTTAKYKHNISLVVEPVDDGHEFVCTAKLDIHNHKSANLTLFVVTENKGPYEDGSNIGCYFVGFTIGFCLGVVMFLGVASNTENFNDELVEMRRRAHHRFRHFRRLGRFRRVRKLVRKKVIKRKTDDGHETEEEVEEESEHSGSTV